MSLKFFSRLIPGSETSNPGLRTGNGDTAYFEFYRGFLGALYRMNEVSGNTLMRRCDRMFIDACTEIKPKICLEIGAYEASFSKEIKGRLPDAKVVALEANPYVFAKYKDEVLAQKVDYRHLCAGPSDGSLTIHIPKDFRGGERPNTNQMASLTENTLTENHEAVKVDALRIDSLVEQLGAKGQTAIAWIDVEGALSSVLPGMIETLKSVDLLYIETENRQIWKDQWLDTDVAAFMMTHGLFPIARDEQRDWQHNWIFASAKLLKEQWLQRRVARLYLPEPKPANA